MTSPAQYLNRIYHLRIGDLNLEAASNRKARELLAKVAEYEKELDEIRKDIRVEIINVCRSYEKQLSGFPTGLKNGFFEQGKVAKVQKVLAERDETIHHFENLLKLIDKYVLALHAARQYLTGSISKNKEKQPDLDLAGT